MSYGSRLARLKALEVEKGDGWLPPLQMVQCLENETSAQAVERQGLPTHEHGKEIYYVGIPFGAKKK